MPDLRGDRVVLRDPRATDAAPYAQAFVDDPELARALAWAEPLTRRAAARRLAGEQRARARGESVRLVISDAGEAFLGLIRLFGLRAAAQVGFMVVAAARRRGLALEALALVVGWALGPLGLDRVGLATRPDNIATQRLAERAGFERASGPGPDLHYVAWA